MKLSLLKLEMCAKLLYFWHQTMQEPIELIIVAAFNPIQQTKKKSCFPYFGVHWTPNALIHFLGCTLIHIMSFPSQRGPMDPKESNSSNYIIMYTYISQCRFWTKIAWLQYSILVNYSSRQSSQSRFLVLCSPHTLLLRDLQTWRTLWSMPRGYR